MKDELAKAISISSIWLSMSIIFAFGIFDFNWGSYTWLLALMSTGLIVAVMITTRSILNYGQDSNFNKEVDVNIK
ncbi:MAG: hypothetical protein HRT53_16600 [Colwellia sp.]|nr:hypothetical protein [Colwellia sp.]